MTDDRITPAGRPVEERVVTERTTEIPVERVHHEHHRHGEEVPDYIGDAFRSRTSWGAIFIGTVVGLAVLILLTLLGLAIGLSAADFGPGDDGFQGFTTGAGIWLVISQFIALGVGGFAAGRMAAIPKTTSTAFHGAAVWGLATLLMVNLASGAVGTIVGGATSTIGTILSGAGQVASAAAPSQATQADVANQAEQAFNAILSQREQNRAGDIISQSAQNVATGRVSVGEAARNVSNRLFGAGGVIGPDDREQAIDQLAQQTGMTQAEARQTVDNVQAQLQQFANNAPATVNRVATEATDALAGVAFWAFVASLLGLAAAVFAAVAGRPGKHEVYDRA